MGSNNLLNAALAYAERGLYILPLVPKGKNPLTKNGYKDATRNRNEIIDWWTRFPDANIGIVTGKKNGFFVIDVDRRDLGNALNLQDFMINVISNRGFHYYFSYGDDQNLILNSKFKDMPIDIKSDGGYIVAPPSIHASGKTYELITPVLNFASDDLLNNIRKRVEPDSALSLPGFPCSGYRKEHIEEMLAVLNPDMDYHDWVKVGMALHSANEDIDLWTQWSSKGAKFKTGECQKKWKTFKNSSDRRISFGTLVMMANENGYSSPYVKAVGTPILAEPLKYQASNSSILLYHWGQLETIPKRKYLVKGLINKGELSVMFGSSNCGKTFCALDLATHIALGRDWCGKKVRKGTVVYIAAEGGLGIIDRTNAFKEHHNLKEIPDIYFIFSTVLLSEGSPMLGELLDKLKQLSDVQLIVVDTLARALGGADENSSIDMGALIGNCNIIQNEIGAHVMIVHHTGKDDNRGARGHSSLKCALDTEIEIKKRDGMIIAEITKQRDGKTGEITNFILKPYMVGEDEDGDPIYSCALVQDSSSRMPISKQSRLTGANLKMFRLINSVIASDGRDEFLLGSSEARTCIHNEVLKSYFEMEKITTSDSPDNIQRIYNRIKKDLKEAGYIEELDSYIWILDKPDK